MKYSAATHASLHARVTSVKSQYLTILHFWPVTDMARQWSDLGVLSPGATTCAIILRHNSCNTGRQNYCAYLVSVHAGRASHAIGVASLPARSALQPLPLWSHLSLPLHCKCNCHCQCLFNSHCHHNCHLLLPLQTPPSKAHNYRQIHVCIVLNTWPTVAVFFTGLQSGMNLVIFQSTLVERDMKGISAVESDFRLIN